MANLIAYRDIPQNSTAVVQLPKLAHGILVQNTTNVYVFVNNDRGAQLINVPPGLTLGWNEPDGVYAPQIGCNGFYQGNGRVYFYDEPIDLTNNPPALQPPGNVPVDIQSGSVIVTAGSVTVTGTASVSDATTQARLSSLISSIGSTKVPSGVLDNSNFATPVMVVPITSFVVSVVGVGRAGLLSVVILGGSNNNTVMSGEYLPGVPQLPYAFKEIVPVNFSIYLFFTGNGSFAVSY